MNGADIIFPELKTSRLLLRRVMPDDLSTILQGYSDSRVNQYMSVSYHTMDEVKVQLDWYEELLVQKKGIWWGICLKSDGKMIGNGGFHLWDHQHRSAELGYWLLPDFQSFGFASEAVKAMLHHAFSNMQLHRVEAIIETENQPSIRMIKRLGFHPDGVRRECEWVQGKYISLGIWSLLQQEYNPQVF